MNRITTAVPLTATRRYYALDGLRGVAALMVLFGHAMLTSPVFADAILGSGRPSTLSPEWWFTYTPLHLLWAGTEAVFIFFILSGFVLTAPTLKAGFSWLAYYRQRLPRLYLPVWGSLVLAASIVALIPRSAATGASWWTNGHMMVSASDVLVDATLFGPISSLNSPLWSLRWEVLFSLLLPVYVLIARWVKSTILRTAGYVIAAFALMALYAFTESEAIRYLPIFALGVLMYTHKEAIIELASRADSRRWVWPSLSFIAILLLSSFWMLQSSGVVPAIVVSASRLVQVAGAALVVVIVLCWRRAARFFEGPAIQWLGSRSFSLYLIHDPIVSSVAFIFGGTASPFVTLAIALPLSLAIAEAFYRVVERPSHLLARRLGVSPARIG